MKKTLLTFALAGLAASAFANYSVYKTDAVNVYVNGSLQGDLVHIDSKQQNNKANLNNYVTKVDNKINGNYVRLRLGTGLDFANKDGLTAGYYARFQTKNTYLKTTDKLHNDAKTADHSDVFGKYVTVDRAYAYLGHKDFGTLTLGSKLNTVVDYGFDYGLNTLATLPNTVLRDKGLDTAANPTVKYDSPVFNKFKFAYSYSNKHGGDSRFSRTNALYGQYDLDGTVVSATAAYNNHYDPQEGFATSQVSKKVDGYELAVQNTSLLPNLYLGAAYDYAKERAYVQGDKAGQTSTNQISLKGAYTVNQYFTPYAVLSYEHSKNNDAKAAETGISKTNKYIALVGAQSEVYKLNSLNVKVFAEGGYVKAKSDYTVNSDAHLKDTTKAVAVGAVVSF